MTPGICPTASARLRPCLVWLLPFQDAHFLYHVPHSRQTRVLSILSTHLCKGCGPAFSAFSLGDVPCPPVTVMVTCAPCLPTTHTEGRTRQAVFPRPYPQCHAPWPWHAGHSVKVCLSQITKVLPRSPSMYSGIGSSLRYRKESVSCPGQRGRHRDAEGSRAPPRHMALRNEPEPHT